MSMTDMRIAEASLHSSSTWFTAATMRGVVVGCSSIYKVVRQKRVKREAAVTHVSEDVYHSHVFVDVVATLQSR